MPPLNTLRLLLFANSRRRFKCLLLFLYNGPIMNSTFTGRIRHHSLEIPGLVVWSRTEKTYSRHFASCQFTPIFSGPTAMGHGACLLKPSIIPTPMVCPVPPFRLHLMGSCFQIPSLTPHSFLYDIVACMPPTVRSVLLYHFESLHPTSRASYRLPHFIADFFQQPFIN